VSQPALSYAYDLAYQISPIIFVGGIASNVLGNALPLLSFLGESVLTGNVSSDNFFARFLPIPGGTLINNTIGTYPFANQQVAANAIIQQPITISLQMIAPCKNQGDYITKLALFTGLQQTFQSHNLSGGSYNVATPAFIYTNCLMTAMTDITSGETNQKQILFQIDFVQPLITQQAASNAFSALNSLYGKLSGGQQSNQNVAAAQLSSGSTTQGAVQASNGMPGVVNTYPLGSMGGQSLSVTSL
jgi:hypothetical protein